MHAMHQTKMSSHLRPRRPKQQQHQQQQKQQHDQERLHQVLSRLQSALHLGLRPASQQKIGEKKWSNTDAEVQVQATRAILAFVRTLSSQQGRPTLPQVLVEDSVAALEGLLGAEREVVYIKAADAAAGLVSTMGDGLLGYGGERLVRPLAQLLKCPKAPTSISAATALHGILAKVKPRSASKRSEDGMWGALEDTDALSTIVSAVEEETGNSGRDAAFLELLAVVLERWSESRYRTGCIDSLPSTLQFKCLSSSVPVAQGALHALSALALCGCSAAIMLKDSEKMWSTVSSCVHPSKPHSVQSEAFRLLTSLCKIPTFGASFTGPHVEGIAAGCSRALEQVRSLGEARWASEVETLVVEAAHATSSVLSWSGPHHVAFVQNGIEDVLLAALSGVQSRRGEKDQQLTQLPPPTAAADRRSRGNKLNPRLRPLLWEIVGWLGAHCNPLSSLASPGQEVLSKQLPALACDAMSKSLRKRGRIPNWYEMVHKPEEADLARAGAEAKTQEGQPLSSQEVVQICKAVLLLISSPSQAIALCTKKCLEDALASHGTDWLPSVVTTLTLAGSNSVKIDHVQTMTNLLALACVSWLEACQEQLLQLKAVEVVLAIVIEHAGDVELKKTDRLSVMSTAVHPVGIKACCLDSQTWEGSDAVLFCALWALFRLLQCSGWAQRVRAKLTEEHLLDKLGSGHDGIREGETLSLLWSLAEDCKMSPGVRWCGVCCLACFGVYGFPSSIGRDMKSAIDDPLSADVVFVLGDGGRLFAHGMMLVARCESMLPANLQAERNANPVPSQQLEVSNRSDGDMLGPVRSAPVEVLLSPRISRALLKALLEFVYTGVVYVPLDLVPEMKVLAKRCHLEPLTSLLQGKSPVWGQPPARFDLSVTLDGRGYSASDIVLQAERSARESSSDKLWKACSGVADHVHAHRVVLSSRCSYFQALFRSGMRDSAQMELGLPATITTIERFLLFLYSAELTREGVSDCAWRHSGTESQLAFLSSLVELAELAGQWVLDTLQEMTVALIGAYLSKNVHLCPPILSLAADKQLWAVVDSCAACLAPEYPQLRDSGALDDLHEELRDLVRAANVKLFMM